jgi:hypothetical protein
MVSEGAMERVLVTDKEIESAQVRVGIGSPLEETRWALRVAQADLSRPLPWEVAAIRLEWFVFLCHAAGLGIHYEPEVVEMTKAGPVFGELRAEVPTDLPLSEAQSIMRQAFRTAAARESLETAIHGRTTLVWMGDQYVLSQEDNLHDVSTAEQLCYAMARLMSWLPRGYVVNACEAPQLRQERLCGRLFLTKRLIQRYCSPACQQRAHHRRNRRPRRPAHA